MRRVGSADSKRQHKQQATYHRSREEQQQQQQQSLESAGTLTTTTTADTTDMNTSIFGHPSSTTATTTSSGTAMPMAPTATAASRNTPTRTMAGHTPAKHPSAATVSRDTSILQSAPALTIHQDDSHPCGHDEGEHSPSCHHRRPHQQHSYRPPHSASAAFAPASVAHTTTTASGKEHEVQDDAWATVLTPRPLSNSTNTRRGNNSSRGAVNKALNSKRLAKHKAARSKQEQKQQQQQQQQQQWQMGSWRHKTTPSPSASGSSASHHQQEQAQQLHDDASTSSNMSAGGGSSKGIKPARLALIVPEPASVPADRRRRRSSTWEETVLTPSPRPLQLSAQWNSLPEEVRSSIERLAEDLKISGLAGVRRRSLLSHSKNAMTGADIVNWLLATDRAETREEAVQSGQLLVVGNLIHAIPDAKDFADSTSVVFRLTDQKHHQHLPSVRSLLADESTLMYGWLTVRRKGRRFGTKKLFCILSVPSSSRAIVYHFVSERSSEPVGFLRLFSSPARFRLRYAGTPKHKNGFLLAVTSPNNKRVCLQATARSAEEQEMWVHALVEAGAEYHEPAQDDFKSARSVYQYSVFTRDNKPLSMDVYKGHVLLITNIGCEDKEVTKKMTQLQSLYSKYKQLGLRICAFPCMQFAGETETTSDIEAMIEDLNITFDVLKTVRVNGAEGSPLFRYLRNALKDQSPHGIFIKDNFELFLVNRKGSPALRFPGSTAPSTLGSEIERLASPQSPAGVSKQGSHRGRAHAVVMRDCGTSPLSANDASAVTAPASALTLLNGPSSPAQSPPRRGRSRGRIAERGRSQVASRSDSPLRSAGIKSVDVTLPYTGGPVTQRSQPNLNLTCPAPLLSPFSQKQSYQAAQRQFGLAFHQQHQQYTQRQQQQQRQQNQQQQHRGGESSGIGAFAPPSPLKGPNSASMPEMHLPSSSALSPLRSTAAPPSGNAAGPGSHGPNSPQLNRFQFPVPHPQPDSQPTTLNRQPQQQQQQQQQQQGGGEAHTAAHAGDMNASMASTEAISQRSNMGYGLAARGSAGCITVDAALLKSPLAAPSSQQQPQQQQQQQGQEQQQQQQPFAASFQSESPLLLSPRKSASSAAATAAAAAVLRSPAPAAQSAATPVSSAPEEAVLVKSPKLDDTALQVLASYDSDEFGSSSEDEEEMEDGAEEEHDAQYYHDMPDEEMRRSLALLGLESLVTCSSSSPGRRPHEHKQQESDTGKKAQQEERTRAQLPASATAATAAAATCSALTQPTSAASVHSGPGSAKVALPHVSSSRGLFLLRGKDSGVEVGSVAGSNHSLMQQQQQQQQKRKRSAREGRASAAAQGSTGSPLHRSSATAFPFMKADSAVEVGRQSSRTQFAFQPQKQQDPSTTATAERKGSSPLAVMHVPLPDASTAAANNKSSAGIVRGGGSSRQLPQAPTSAKHQHADALQVPSHTSAVVGIHPRKHYQQPQQQQQGDGDSSSAVSAPVILYPRRTKDMMLAGTQQQQPQQERQQQQQQQRGGECMRLNQSAVHSVQRSARLQQQRSRHQRSFVAPKALNTTMPAFLHNQSFTHLNATVGGKLSRTAHHNTSRASMRGFMRRGTSTRSTFV